MLAVQSTASARNVCRIAGLLAVAILAIFVAIGVFLYGFDIRQTAKEVQDSASSVHKSLEEATSTSEQIRKANEAVNKLNPQNPDDRVTVQRIWQSPNPGEALVTWHRNQETLREVGNDPAAFKERIAKETRESLVKDPEFRKQLLADLRKEAGASDDGNGKPKSEFKLPRSLNGALGGTSRETVAASESDDSQNGIFESAWR